MATYNELPVYKATYDLLLEMFRFTKDFSSELFLTQLKNLLLLSRYKFISQSRKERKCI